MNRRQRDALFEQYLQERIAGADAITPGQKLALLAALEQELEGRDPQKPGMARVPREGGGTVLLPVQHTLVAAALEGRPVSMGGRVISSGGESATVRLRNMGDAQKVGVLALVALLPLLFVGAFLLLRGDDENVAVAAEVGTTTPTASPAVTPSPSPTATIVPTEAAPVVLSPTPLPPTPTPYSITLLSGEAAPTGNDPASLEIAGFSYILSTGQVQNGIWEPQGAEWLAGTALRRVTAVPFEPEIANAVATMRPGTVLRLRLRSGEITEYRVVEVRRQQRQQIEVLADRKPSLALILHSEPTTERWVVIAEAIQEPQEFAVYTSGVPTGDAAGLPSLDPQPPPMTDTTGGPLTILPLDTTSVITATRTVTHTAAGLRLTVKECERAGRIGMEEPPRTRQQFLICDVTLTALEEAEGTVSYSGHALAITEQAWITTQVDWWPPTVEVSRALRSGTLNPGSSTSGRVAGLVSGTGGLSLGGSRSQPVIAWEQAGVRYLIQVEADNP